MSKYYMELNVSDLGEVTGYEDTHSWMNYDTLEASGDNFQELVDSATISTADQDGGEGAIVSLGDLPASLYRAVERMMAVRYGELEEEFLASGAPNFGAYYKMKREMWGR